jgi:acetylornithine/succinyldiaminopimelate/putrescine aminotransferase
MRRGLAFLDQRSPARLLKSAGKTIRSVPAFQPIDKSALPDSYGGNQTGPGNDFLVGRGLFFINEQRRLIFDCSAGHYQMTWGYGHPELCAGVEAAVESGVCWDNHSNIPQSPLKELGHRLVKLANKTGEKDPLDTVLLGVCTGSVACGAALKIQLEVFRRVRSAKIVPVVISLAGSYHGTDMVPQFMRGMWAHLARPFEALTVEPNDAGALGKVFREHGHRIAGFWAEPVLMNREAMAVKADYLLLAQDLCRKAGALMCIDEIQTGFWRPEVFEYRALGLQPDLVVLGKGMTAGFHPLSGVLMRSRHDVLAQYDAISTNGGAALPAYVALCSLELIRKHSGRIRRMGRRIEKGFQDLAAEYPAEVLAAQGRGFLSGLKFRRVETALEMHRQLLEAGIWTRAHAYHEGHSAVLTKLGLLADEDTVDFMLEGFRSLLSAKSGGRRKETQKA